VNLLGAEHKVGLVAYHPHAGIIRDIRVDLAFDVLNVVGGPASGVFSSASMFVSSRLLHCSHVVLTCIRTHLRVFRHRHHLIQSKMQLLALLLGKRHCSKVTRERPRRRAAEQRDELAPPHSITSSAATISFSGTLRPSALAVW
jgi:hypothetical protein